jgi:hypothetical protein
MVVDGRFLPRLWNELVAHCFRANPAYSLCGVLKGNNDNGCTSGTYINSFFTNYGVDAFEPVMEAAGVFSEDNAASYTDQCKDGDDDGNDAEGGGCGGGTSYANKGGNMGSTSYGISCDGNQFVTKKTERMKLRSPTFSNPSMKRSIK